jgi:hypothetical protein
MLVAKGEGMHLRILFPYEKILADSWKSAHPENLLARPAGGSPKKISSDIGRHLVVQSVWRSDANICCRVSEQALSVAETRLITQRRWYLRLVSQECVLC